MGHRTEVDQFADTRSFGFVERRQCNHGCCEPGVVVGLMAEDLQRRLVVLIGRPRRLVRPATCVAHRQFDCRVLRVKTAPPEGCDGADDHFRAIANEGIEVDAEFLERPTVEVGHDDVCLVDQWLEAVRTVGRVTGIDHHRPLVGVEREEHATCVGVRVRGERPTSAGLVPMGRLDLDHVGAQIGQQTTGEGSRRQVAQLEHANTGERAGDGGGVHPGILSSRAAAPSGRSGRRISVDPAWSKRWGAS